nr:hypothetical protein [Tanacetum cinerariifolium]
MPSMMSSGSRTFVAADVDLAGFVVPGRNAVAPPELTADAPVLDVAHPREVHVFVLLGHESDAAVFDSGDGRLGQRLGRHVPLVCQPRLDNGAGTVALRHLQCVIVDADQQAGGVEGCDDLLAGFEAVETCIGGGQGAVDRVVERAVEVEHLGGWQHRGILVEDVQQRQVVTLADFVVVEVVGGGDLHAASAELGAHEGLFNGLGQTVVHREAFAAPVDRRAQATNLTADVAAGLILPFPDFFQKFIATQVVAILALRLQLTLHQHLRGDTGMVGARLPEGVATLHAAKTDQGVHDRVVETVAHVQAAGDVRRRNHDGVRVARTLRSEIVFGLPGQPQATGGNRRAHGRRLDGAGEPPAVGDSVLVLACSALVLSQEAFHPRIQTALDFVLDVRGEVVDHVLHDQLCRCAKFGINVQQRIGTRRAGRGFRRSRCRRDEGSGGLGREQGNVVGAGFMLFGGYHLAGDDIEQHGNLLIGVNRLGQQRRLGRIIAQQLANGLEVIQQRIALFAVEAKTLACRQANGWILDNDLGDTRESFEEFRDAQVEIDQQILMLSGVAAHTQRHRSVLIVLDRTMGHEGLAPEPPQPGIQLFALLGIAAMQVHLMAKAPCLVRQFAGEVQARERVGTGQNVKIDLGHGGSRTLNAPAGEVRPLIGFCETREEARCGDGAGLRATDVGDVGKRAVQLLLILIEQRQLPGAVVGALAGFQHLGDQRVAVAHQARRVTAQRNDAGAGQCGDVDDGLRLEAFGIGQRVAQHQTAFGVGVEDLDGLAAHGFDDVARAGCVAAWHVFSRCDDAHQVDRQLQLQHSIQGPEHAGRATHVELHLVHAQAWLEADAASVKGDALADQYVRFFAFLAVGVLHDDQTWRLCAALTDCQERTHAQLLDVFLIQDFDLQALVGLAHRFGLLAQVGRVADVGRHVAQVAGHGHAGGNGLRMPGGALDIGDVGFGGQQGDFFQGARVDLLTLEPVEDVFAVGQGFDQQTQYTFGFEVGQAVQQQALPDFAREVATLEDCADRAAAQCVQAACGVAQRAAFTDGDHQRGGLQATPAGHYPRAGRAGFSAGCLVELQPRSTRCYAVSAADQQAGRDDRIRHAGAGPFPVAA